MTASCGIIPAGDLSRRLQNPKSSEGKPTRSAGPRSVCSTGPGTGSGAAASLRSIGGRSHLATSRPQNGRTGRRPGKACPRTGTSSWPRSRGGWPGALHSLGSCRQTGPLSCCCCCRCCCRLRTAPLPRRRHMTHTGLRVPGRRLSVVPEQWPGPQLRDNAGPRSQPGCPAYVLTQRCRPGHRQTFPANITVTQKEAQPRAIDAITSHKRAGNDGGAGRAFGRWFGRPGVAGRAGVAGQAGVAGGARGD